MIQTIEPSPFQRSSRMLPSVCLTPFPVLILLAAVVQHTSAQADGNPHHWDRRRRCDHTDYSPPCGACEGYGGIPYGDKNDQIHLTTCEIIANASSIPASSLIKPDWGISWTSPVHEVLIGKKNDPFCFNTFPSNSSVGPLCYRPDHGVQTYDMSAKDGVRALREDVTLVSSVGNIESLVLHQSEDLWIVNRFPWYAAHTHQCICVNPHQGSDPTQPAVYPVQYNWTQQTFFVGREKIGVEYINQTMVLDHWAFGPHHVWSVPKDGRIVRMWQPFNGLQVIESATGTHTEPVNVSLFSDIPPSMCKKGGATFRIGCDDNGYPKPKDASKGNDLSKKDALRAKQKVPRPQFKGDSFTTMSKLLNSALEKDPRVPARPCDSFSAQEIQLLQTMLYQLRDDRLDDVYRRNSDNRRITRSLSDLQKTWDALNAAVQSHPTASAELATVQRDGHCHEAVMWYVHHLTDDLKDIISMNGFSLPMLATQSHHSRCNRYSAINSSVTSLDLDPVERDVCRLYQEHVTCFSCHSNSVPSVEDPKQEEQRRFQEAAAARKDQDIRHIAIVENDLVGPNE